MDDKPDELIRQRLRVAEGLDFTPGRAKDPEGGPPISILTYGNKAGIEQPLMFTVKDVKRLVVHGLVILATFGDETDEEIVVKYCGGKEINPDILWTEGIGLHLKTIEDRLVIIKQWFKWAVVKARPPLLLANSIALEEIGEAESSPQPCFTPERVATLLANADPDQEGPVYAVMAYLGLRFEEVRDLRWSDARHRGRRAYSVLLLAIGHLPRDWASSQYVGDGPPD